MISCTEFIPAYSELFKYLERKGGKAAVTKYWERIAKDGLDNLHREVSQNGLKGCWNYWAHALNEEAADFEMTLDEEKGEFRITMHHCPSKGRLLEETHLDPYSDYCGHCPALYKGLIESYGLTYESDLSGTDKAACAAIITDPNVKG
jgi:hypothetical protein